MKSASLLMAFVVVAVTNLLGLAHAWMNRTGQPDAAIALTGQELSVARTLESDTSIDFEIRTDAGNAASGLVNQTTLKHLGFQLEKQAGHPAALFYYRKQPHRLAFIALTRTPDPEPRFRVVDAARNAAALRGRYPDTATTIILPGVVSIEARPAMPAQEGYPATPAIITALVREIPTRIHIPKPFSTAVRGPGKNFRLHVRYGRFHEPWVTGVDILPDR